MIQINGLWWPDDVGDRWRHSLRHVQSLEYILQRCRRKRTAIQAGGNVGIWPRRMYLAGFQRVITFEPDAISRACLEKNVPPGVSVRHEALGSAPGRCAIARKSLGSHRVVDGDDVDVVTVDSLDLRDVDLLQLDLEGYELHALRGAQLTLDRCRPMVQVELAGFTAKYGASDVDVFDLLRRRGYRIAAQQIGSDYVFEPVP